MSEVNIKITSVCGTCHFQGRIQRQMDRLRELSELTNGTEN